MSDVEASGALPVPLHLRNAAHRGMKQHGIGVGYRYSHDYEGADVEQQYLPDAIAARRYYLPTDQGYEATIAARMAARAEARAAAKAAGKTAAIPHPRPGGRPTTPATAIMKTRETNRKKLADTEKRDRPAHDGPWRQLGSARDAGRARSSSSSASSSAS